MSENQRLILAVTISLLITLSWNFYNAAKYKDYGDENTKQQVETKVPTIKGEETYLKREDVLAEGNKDKTRVAFENDLLKGSINLKGARLDDVTLKDYHVDLEKSSPNIELLSPSQTKHPYFAEFGWVSTDKTLELPGKDTLWQAETKAADKLHIITLKWQNSQKVNFIIELKLDDKYMFNITQKVTNHDNKPIRLKSYSLLSRKIQGNHSEDIIAHEGVVSVIEDGLALPINIG
jgi:YidC/Oxa1 family membrane protein insertase